MSPSRGNSGFMDMESADVIQSTTPEKAEKMLSQSQVDDIVKGVKLDTQAKVRRELEEQYSDRYRSSSSQPQSADLEEKLFNKMLERAEKMRAEKQKEEEQRQEAEYRAKLQEKADNLFVKLKMGEEKYSDFKDVMQDFDLGAFPNIALLAGDVDNTADVMYELANNPYKIAQLDELAKRAPTLAKKELSKLSQSINVNEQAKLNNVTSPEPFTRPKSSKSGSGDSGKMTIADFKKQPWLRG